MRGENCSYHVRQTRVKQLPGGLHHPLHVSHSANARLRVSGVHPEYGAFADPELIQLSGAVEPVHADPLDFSVLLVGTVEDTHKHKSNQMSNQHTWISTTAVLLLVRQVADNRIVRQISRKMSSCQQFRLLLNQDI